MPTFLQVAWWPILTAGICIWLRRPIHDILTAIARRVEEGDSFEAPPFKLGSQTKLTAPDTEKLAGGVSIEDGEEFPHRIYLLHKATRDKRLDKNDRTYYRIEIWVDADSADLMHEIESITYFLHPTFKDPIRTVSSTEDAFTLKTNAWGRFLLYATVNLKGAKPSLHIERYLDF